MKEIDPDRPGDETVTYEAKGHGKPICRSYYELKRNLPFLSNKSRGYIQILYYILFHEWLSRLSIILQNRMKYEGTIVHCT